MHAADVNKITETLNSKDSFITCHSKNFVNYIKVFISYKEYFGIE